jgi:2-oxoisovalerate dehydrogenase E1 component alpha subunit
MRDMAYGLIRVLDDDGVARGPWAPAIAPETLRAMLRAMMLTRAFDDRMFRAQRQGKTSFYVKSLGEEAVSIGAAFALDDGDMLFPSYRQQGLLIARNWDLVDMMNQILSNRADRMKGRQLPVMYSAKAAGFFSISGNLATQLPQAVGWAMASAARGDTRIAAAWLGEGSTAEGDFHSACTFASVYRVPVVLNVVNNQWAISSFSGFAGARRRPLPRAGWLWHGFAAGGRERRSGGAGRHALGGGTGTGQPWPHHDRACHLSRRGPFDQRRPLSLSQRREASAWPLGDPVARLKQHLMALGAWDEDAHTAMQEEVTAQVRAAQKRAETHGILGHGFNQPLETMFEGVFEEMPWHLAEQEAQMLAEWRAAGLPDIQKEPGA